MNFYYLYNLNERKLIILNLTFYLLPKLLTLKQNQVVCPLVLLSTLIKRSYSVGPTEMARSKLPHSKLESNFKSSFFIVGFIPVNNLYSIARMGQGFYFYEAKWNQYLGKCLPYISFCQLVYSCYSCFFENALNAL